MYRGDLADDDIDNVEVNLPRRYVFGLKEFGTLIYTCITSITKYKYVNNLFMLKSLCLAFHNSPAPAFTEIG